MALKRAVATFDIEVEFDSAAFDSEDNLQVAWYDPSTGTFTDYCDQFTSEPRSAEKRTSEAISVGTFNQREQWSIEASIEYDPDIIDLDTARLDVLEFDQDAGEILPTPRNATIRIDSKVVLAEPTRLSALWKLLTYLFTGRSS